MAAPLHAHLEGRFHCGDISCCSGSEKRPNLRLNKRTGQLEVDTTVSSRRKESANFSYENLWEHFQEDIKDQYGIEVVRFVEHLDLRNPEVRSVMDIIRKVERNPKKFKAAECLALQGLIKREMNRLAASRPKMRTVGVQVFESQQEVARRRSEPKTSPFFQGEASSESIEGCESGSPLKDSIRSERKFSSGSVEDGHKEEAELSPTKRKVHFRSSVPVPEPVLEIEAEKAPKPRKRVASAVAIPVMVRAGREKTLFSPERLLAWVQKKCESLSEEAAEVVCQEVLEKVYVETYVFGSAQRGEISVEKISSLTATAVKALARPF